MIPIKLTIAGLYSYQQKQTIDFTKLTNANLFGIFGSVGSGKSSILEAITFAIYGRTDRLNLSGDNRNYNMMNLKSDELLIDFEFETGKNQIPFRATVKGKRNSKRFDNVKTLDRNAYRFDGANWIPIETTVLEQEIGLSYENFKRTVIIPQGQFQEFLQLGNTDRTKMMKELFNLEKFELYYNVTSLETKNNAKKQTIEGQLLQLGEINPDHVKIYDEQLIQLNKELAELDKTLRQNQQKEQEWQKIKELSTKSVAAKTELANLLKQEPEYIQLEKTIRQYEKSVFEFKTTFDLLEASTKKIASQSNQIEQDSIKLQKEETEINAQEKTLAALQTEFDKREKLKQQAEELEKLRHIRTKQNEIEKEKLRLVNGTKILSETNEKTEQLGTQLKEINEFIKAERLKLPNLVLLAKIKDWHNTKETLDKQLKENNEEIVKLQTLEEKTQKEIELVLNASANDLPQPTTPERITKFFQQKTESLKTKIEKIDKDLDHLRVQAQLEKYASNLEDGSPCPLCGSTHHPAMYNADNANEDQIRFKKTKTDLESEIAKITEAALKVKELERQVNFYKQQKTALIKKQETNKQNLAAHIYDKSWPEFENKTALEKSFDAAAQLQKVLTNKEEEKDGITKALETALKNKETYQTAIDKINREITVLQTETNTFRMQLKLVSAEEYQNHSIEEIKTEQEQLLSSYLNIEKQYNELSRRLIELRKQKDTLAGILSANQKEMLQEKLNSEALQNKLKQQLEKSEYSDFEQIKQVLALSIDVEKQKSAIASFNQNLTLLKSRVKDLETELNKRVYDAEEHQQILNELRNSNTAISAKKEKSGEIKTLMNKLHKDLESRLALTKELEKLMLRADNIKTLKSLFKASGFVNYISSVYLQNLCNAANERFFRLTRQKLSLEISEDNNFRVRDFMNGGKIRSVKTLSGGQTFQAALSLALALADNIQRITESNQNFFFLDEGFGSLDKEALAVVFDTLKALRKEDRIVGVISHVEEMQQEIDVHLRIENSEEHGSLVKASWSN
ncbi:SMC family ATPase [uncultured Draconibacterium sp.]|uniref:SMC family ATPase n=1 Tax=uncultured Draconibacterium sp. TaxID=1573823 RepID=UPI0032165E63